MKTIWRSIIDEPLFRRSVLVAAAKFRDAHSREIYLTRKIEKGDVSLFTRHLFDHRDFVFICRTFAL